MSLADPLTPAMRRRVNAMAERVVACVLNEAQPTRPLTEREREVFVRLERGETRKEIAAALNLPIATVQTRIDNARRAGHSIPQRRGA